MSWQPPATHDHLLAGPPTSIRSATTIRTLPLRLMSRFCRVGPSVGGPRTRFLKHLHVYSGPYDHHSKIRNTLEAAGAKGTFFVNGNNCERWRIEPYKARLIDVPLTHTQTTVSTTTLRTYKSHLTMDT